MGRIEMKYIEDTRRRREAYRKRAKNVKKKTYELSQLCDIPALMICYGEEGDVITWPENKQEINQIAQRFRRCNFNRRRNRTNPYIFRNPERMKECIEATKRQVRKMPAEKVNEIRQSLESKLNEIQERIRFLTPQLNQNNNDNAVEESITEVEMVDNSDNSQGSHQALSFDLNELASGESGENEQDDNIPEEAKHIAESEQALENKGETSDKSRNVSGSSILAIPSMEQDENRIRRMVQNSVAMELFNWHKDSMNYWSSQIFVHHNSDSCNLNHPLNFAPPSMNSMSSLAGFVPPPPPPSFVQPGLFAQHHNGSTLLIHGMQSANRDVANGGNNRTGV